MPRKYKGLGVGGFCLPEKSIRDHVTQEEMQQELSRLRAAITILANRLFHQLGSEDTRTIGELVARPEDRARRSS